MKVAVYGVCFLFFYINLLNAQNNIGIQIGDKKYSGDNVRINNSIISNSSNGSVITKDCKVGEFRNLHLKTVAMVSIEVGKESSCRLIADGDVTSKILFNVSNSTLTIDSKESFSTNSELKILLTTKDLESIVSDGAGTIKFSNLNNNKLSLKLYGSSFIVGKGVTKNLSILTDGAVEANLKELKATNVLVQADGSSEIFLWVEEYLDAKVNGSADISYKGKPKKIKKEIKGAGDIERDE